MPQKKTAGFYSGRFTDAVTPLSDCPSLTNSANLPGIPSSLYPLFRIFQKAYLSDLQKYSNVTFS